MAVLGYGAESSVSLEFAEGVALCECGTPRGRPLESVSATLADALGEPLDYPPLGACTTPGDRVVLALDRGLPRAAEMVAGVIEALVAAGVDVDGISVLRSQAESEAGEEDPRRLLPESLAGTVPLLTHAPADREQLAFLSRTKADHPILVNRALHDADLIVPIGLVHREQAAGYFGIHSGVFPTFADQETIERFRSPKTLADGADRRQLAEEVGEVAWLLGVHFTVQVVPGGGGSVLHILAGRSEAVARRAGALYRDAWRWPIGRAASLVVAGIEGDSSRQTWQRFGRALQAAASIVEDGGSIAVCCDLAEAPGPAVQRLVGGESRRTAVQAIGRERSADALPAIQLAQALDRGKVYLLSRLDSSLVESLDMIYLAEPAELGRLARLHTSCVVLANAADVEVVVEETV